jgi:uncharacterized protein YacL
MSTDFIFRIIGMLVFSGAGIYWGVYLGGLAAGSRDLYAVVMGLVGALTGLVLTPFFTSRPLRLIRNWLGEASSNTLVASVTGLIAGLLVAALVSYPISLLPSPLGEYLPLVGAIVFGYLGIAVFAVRQDELMTILRPARPREPSPPAVQPAPPAALQKPSALVDTSVLIDGRIADIARTGFLPELVIIPRFVLNELQYIADSPEALRRQRGRRGMDVLSALQKEPSIQVEIRDGDVPGANAVDDKLVRLAKKLGCAVLTNDFNLNRVAEIQGVKILNINDLANAVKTVYLPGESLMVEIIQEGKEYGQGVGYLDDGTMIVVENGGQRVGSTVETVVTKVLQTAAGRMIFSRQPDNSV